MMKDKKPLRRFEELIAWQKARDLTRAIYATTSQRSFNQDYGFRDQLRRASVSTMANIAEGFERGGRAEFHQFLSVAKGSCAELRSHLYVAADTGILDQKHFTELLAEAEQVSRIVGALRASVQRQRDQPKLRSISDQKDLSPQSSVLSPD
jgi:four helix bundle protein